MRRNVVVFFTALTCFGLLLNSSVSSSKARSVPYRWTFAVYLDADNSLNGYDDKDIQEMMKVGSDSNVNIVCWWDKPNRNTTIIYVNKGSYTTVRDYGVNRNSGDPQSLVDFINYLSSYYPAAYLVLDLWDHGGGFHGICWDDTSHDKITMVELMSAFTIANKKVDILAADACLMGMLEVAFQVQGFCDYFVASEETIPAYGFPYDTILGDLTGNPSMPPRGLTVAIVNRYIQCYGTSKTKVTLSSVDMKYLYSLVSAVDTLACDLNANLDAYGSRIKAAIRNTDKYDSSYIVDLYDFAKELKAKVGDKTIQSDCQFVMGNVTLCIVVEGHGSRHADSHGISIYHPSNSGQWYSDYLDLEMSKNDHWDEYVRAYVGA